MIIRQFVVLVLVAMLFDFATAIAAESAPPAEADLQPHSVGKWGVDLGDRDPAVKPGDNFYMSQNGAWYDRTQLGSAQPMAAYWRDIRRLSPLRLAAILDAMDPKQQSAVDDAERKARDLYRAFMDEEAIEKKGREPLESELAHIRAAKSRQQMTELMGEEAGPYVARSVTTQVTPPRSVFTLDVAQDAHEPTRNSLYVGQGGLMLPGPEYYFDPKLADYRQAYQEYVAKLLRMIDWPEPDSRAKDIVAFETRIARASWSHEEMLDRTRTYNHLSFEALTRLAPGLDWAAFFKGAELGKVSDVVVDAKSAFPRIAGIYSDTPLEVLRARQAFAAAEAAGEYLDRAFAEAVFDFRGRKFVSPSLQQLPRRFRAEWAVEASMPDTVGALYVKHYFSAAAKSKAVEMAENLKKALDARLQNLAWMEPATKVAAREKLARMKTHIGYPDRFRDYATLVITDTDLYGDIKRSQACNWRERVARLGKDFDSSLWGVTPNYANYNYSPTSNTMEMPAAILQPPFFDLDADEAVNYGAIGALMGQNIMFAFADQGRHYDAGGHLREWWTAAESNYFDEQARRLSARYDAIEPIPGVHVNGALVLNEAIADLGGMLIAFDAYHLSLHSGAPPVVDGFSGDQRFFLGRAQMWRAKFPLEFTRNQLATGSNAPPFIRVNGPLPHIDAWYAAFNVEPGDKMYLAPADRVRLW